jgi:hypothetical protein
MGIGSDGPGPLDADIGGEEGVEVVKDTLFDNPFIIKMKIVL